MAKIQIKSKKLAFSGRFFPYYNFFEHQISQIIGKILCVPHNSVNNNYDKIIYSSMFIYFRRGLKDLQLNLTGYSLIPLFDHLSSYSLLFL